MQRAPQKARPRGFWLRGRSLVLAAVLFLDLEDQAKDAGQKPWAADHYDLHLFAPLSSRGFGPVFYCIIRAAAKKGDASGGFGVNYPG